MNYIHVYWLACLNDIDMFKLSNDIVNKSHLLFAWSCSRFTNIINMQSSGETVLIDDCYHLLEQPLSAETLVTLAPPNNLTRQDKQHVTKVTFEFGMVVSDNREHLHRSDCITLQLVTIDSIYPNDSQYRNNTIASTSTTKWFDVSLTAMKRHIKKNERLRLIADVNLNYNSDNINGDDISYQCVCNYSELNGYLTDEYIDNHRIEIRLNNSIYSINQSNLILESNSLDSDVWYIFNVDVVCKRTDQSDLDSTNTQLKGSANLEIYVNKEPIVIDGTFSVEPDCSNITVDEL